MNKLGAKVSEYLTYEYHMPKVYNPKHEVGLEIEVEGDNLPHIENNHWISKADHSLRGRDNREYIFNGPKMFEAVPKLLDELAVQLAQPGVRVSQSHRTSVHVHLNMLDHKLQEVYTLICLYMLIEHFLVAYSGPDREGNMYCLRTSDAEYLPMRIIEGLRDETYFGHVADDNIRYSSLNLKALTTFGSFEFRSFRGSVDKEEIWDWVKTLRQFLNAGKAYATPLDVVRDYQDNGPGAILQKVFQGLPILQAVLVTANWKDVMQNGFLYAFEIAYAPRKNPWIADLAKVTTCPYTDLPKSPTRKGQIEFAPAPVRNRIRVNAIDPGQWVEAQPAAQPGMVNWDDMLQRAQAVGDGVANLLLPEDPNEL